MDVVITFAQEIPGVEYEELLERFYEETGKNITIDELQFLSQNPIILERNAIKQISELLYVDKEVAKKIILMVEQGFTFDEVCDSLLLLPSQCKLLKIFTKKSENLSQKTKVREVSRKSDEDYSLMLKSRLYSYIPSDTGYLGSPVDSYHKVYFSSPTFLVGGSVSKDAGEVSLLDNQKYFASFKFAGNELVLGKFIAQNNFGTILWSPQSKFKGQNPALSSFGTKNKILPTTSSAEYGVFNGLCFSSSFDLFGGYFNILGFISQTNRSGNYDTALDVVTSIYTVDYYSDSNSLKKRNILKERTYFFSTTIGFGEAELSYSFLNLSYNKPIQTLSKKFISGKDASFHSFLLKSRILENVKLAWEFNLSKKNDIATIFALNFSLRQIVSTLNVRYFSLDFRSPFGTTFGENSYPNNEFGIFFGLEFSSKNLEFDFYADFFRSLGPTFLLQVPFKGTDFFVQLVANPLNWLTNKIRLQRKEKTDYTYNIQKTQQIPFQKVIYRFLLDNFFKIGNSFQLRWRLDYVFLHNANYLPNESGIHSFIELKTNQFGFFELGTRLNYCITDSYNSAIYVFQVFAPEFMYSIPFYQKNFRFSAWGNLKIVEGLNLHLMYFYDQKSNVRNFLLGQIDFKYKF
ncbi:MAG: hypothetical protein N2517_00865 [Ignavibacteria bacterium]|nr:hypothetical protein [Ignavibacteria bacterium]